MLVDEYQDTNRLQAAILLGAEARRPRADRGRRRRAVDLRLPRGARCATSSTSPAFRAAGRASSTLEQNYRSTEPILAAANAVIAEARERFAKGLLDRPAAGARGRRSSPCATRPARSTSSAARSSTPARPARALKEQAVLFRAAHHSRPARGRADPAQHPLREVRRAEVPRRRPRQGRAGAACASPRTRATGWPASGCCSSLPGIGPATAEAVLAAMAAAAGAGAGAAARAGAAAGGARLGRRSSTLFAAAARRRRPGRPSSRRCARWYEPHLERLHEDAAVRRADLVQLEQIAAGFASRERFLTELTLDPPGATSDQAGAPHRDEDYLILSTIHSAKGQEWQRGLRAELRRRLHPLRPRHRHQRRDRGGAAAALRGDDPRPRRAAPDDAAALLRPRPARRGDRHVYAARSRFIPDRIPDRFEAVAWPPCPSCQPGAAAAGGSASWRRSRRAHSRDVGLDPMG